MRLSMRRARAYTAAFLIASSFGIPAAAQGSRIEPRPAFDISNIRIDNFGRVDSTVYRGGQPKGRDDDDLAALGVKTLIDLTSDDADASEPAMAARAGLKYFAIPMTTHRAPTDVQLAQFLRIVGDLANQPVYVHCVGGRHRTGVMTAAYRMTHDGWSAARAFAEMKQYKFGPDFLHSELKDFVFAYPATLASRAPVSAAAATKAGG